MIKKKKKNKSPFLLTVLFEIEFWEIFLKNALDQYLKCSLNIVGKKLILINKQVSLKIFQIVERKQKKQKSISWISMVFKFDFYK